MARNEVSTVLTASLIQRLTGADKMVQDRVHPGFQIREERLRDEHGPEGWRNLLRAIQLVRGRARDRTLDFRLAVNLSCY